MLNEFASIVVSFPAESTDIIYADSMHPNQRKIRVGKGNKLIWKEKACFPIWNQSEALVRVNGFGATFK